MDDNDLDAPLAIAVPGELDGWISSSKIDRMLEVVRDVIARREKVIVFSQFTSLLKLIEKPLNQEGTKYLTVRNTFCQAVSVILIRSKPYSYSSLFDVSYSTTAA